MQQKIKLSELATLSINHVIDSLSDSYTKLIKDGIDLSVFPSVMLWGQPGVGKSAAIKQIGERIHQATGKRVDIGHIDKQTAERQVAHSVLTSKEILVHNILCFSKLAIENQFSDLR